MAPAFTTTLVIEPAVDVTVTLSNTGDPTSTGFGEAVAAAMLIAAGPGCGENTAAENDASDKLGDKN